MAHTDAVVKLALREGTQHQKAMEKVLLETTMVQEKTPKLEIAKVKVTTET